MMNVQQMELGFDGAPTPRLAQRRQRKLANARWWFDQMRRAVDSACDWQREPSARPEQAHLVLPRGRA